MRCADQRTSNIETPSFSQKAGTNRDHPGPCTLPPACSPPHEATLARRRRTASADEPARVRRKVLPLPGQRTRGREADGTVRRDVRLRGKVLSSQDGMRRSRTVFPGGRMRTILTVSLRSDHARPALNRTTSRPSCRSRSPLPPPPHRTRLSRASSGPNRRAASATSFASPRGTT